MTLKPQSLALTVLLGLLTAAGPLATDMYLPSLPVIADDLGTSVASAQLTLSGFLFGFAAGQLVYGLLSDRLGRKPVLMAALALFALTTAGCALASSIEALIALRVLQALGAAGPVVLARAVARDLFEGRGAARMLSRMGMVMGFVPAAAPVLGGLVQTAFGWRAVFLVILLFAGALAVGVWRLLAESLHVRDGRPLSLRAIAATYAELMASAVYRRYVAAASLTFAGLFAFISGSSFVLQGYYGLGPQAFGLCFAVAVLGYIAGTYTASRLVVRIGVDRSIHLGSVLVALGGLGALALMGLDVFGFAGLLAPMVVYLFGVGLVMPQALAGALMPFPGHAGAASSFLGFLQMAFAAAVGALVGHMLVYGPLALPAAIAAMGVAAYALAAAAGFRTRPAI